MSKEIALLKTENKLLKIYLCQLAKLSNHLNEIVTGKSIDWAEYHNGIKETLERNPIDALETGIISYDEYVAKYHPDEDYKIIPSNKEIGIKFSDNDFINTFYGFLTLLKEAIEWNPENKFSKEDILVYFNQCKLSIHSLFQDNNNNNEDLDHLSKYLEISIDNIYFNNEVLEYIKEHDRWNNSEFHILNVETGLIYSV